MFAKSMTVQVHPGNTASSCHRLSVSFPVNSHSSGFIYNRDEQIDSKLRPHMLTGPVTTRDKEGNHLKLPPIRYPSCPEVRILPPGDLVEHRPAALKSNVVPVSLPHVVSDPLPEIELAIPGELQYPSSTENFSWDEGESDYDSDEDCDSSADQQASIGDTPILFPPQTQDTDSKGENDPSLRKRTCSPMELAACTKVVDEMWPEAQVEGLELSDMVLLLQTAAKLRDLRVALETLVKSSEAYFLVPDRTVRIDYNMEFLVHVFSSVEAAM